MKRVAFVGLLLCVAVSGEEPVGKKSGTVVLGTWSRYDYHRERFEVYEDWERGYFVYKQVQEDGYVDVPDTVSITAVPIRSDWPPRVKAEEDRK